MSRNGLRSLRWERGENRIQAIGRAMNHAPRSDGGEIEILKPLNSEHISGVIEILSPPPPELLHNKILRLRNPYRPPQTRQNEPPSSTELMLHKRIVEEREEFDEERRIDPCRSDMPPAPGQRVELHLRIEDYQRRERRHHPLNRLTSSSIDDDIDIACRPGHPVKASGEGAGEHVFDTGCLAGVKHSCGKLFDGHRTTGWLLAGGPTGGTTFRSRARRSRSNRLRTSRQPSAGSAVFNSTIAPSCMRTRDVLVRSNASDSR